MNNYLAIITTVLVITQVIRLVQNAIQLRRQKILFEKQCGQLKDITEDDLEVQRRVYRAALGYLEHGERKIQKMTYDENALKVMLDPGAKMPTRAHTADAGLDLYSPVDTIVFPRWRKGAKHSATIDTGVHVAIPVGYVGDVKSKSSLMMQDIITDGTVDSGYTGSIRVKLWNLGVEPVHIQAGQKIAQLVLKQIITPVPVLVDSLEETDRGEGGFGSTGAF